MGRKKMIISDMATRFEWFPWFILAFVGMAELFAYAKKPSAPVMVYSVDVLTPTVRMGEMAKFSFYLSRMRQCPATTHGFWVDWTGRSVQSFSVKETGYTKVGTNKVPLHVPAPMETGKMCYRSVSYSVCETGLFVTDTPDACVEVIAP